MNPAEEYSARLGHRQAQLTAADRLDARLGSVRLLLAICFLLLAFFSLQRRDLSAAWLLLPGVAFLAAIAYHHRIRARQNLARRARDFYQGGVDRLDGRRTHTTGSTGDEFSDEQHLYGADLDLFGAAGLYRRICSARTPMGEQTLARWLLHPASLEVIKARQQCITELRAKLEFREDMAILGAAQRIALHPEAISTWLQAPRDLAVRGLRPAAFALCGLAIAGALWWAMTGLAAPFLAVLVIEAALNYVLRNDVQRAVAGIEHANEDIRLLSALLARVESESFSAPLLLALKAQLSMDSERPSITLGKLATLVNFVEARRNPFLIPLMLPLLYTLQAALAAERWREAHGRSVTAWLDVLGEIEALNSFAGYSFERPADPFPEFVAGPALFVAVGLGHPLIPAAARVCNDVAILQPVRVLLVSGSNMSGKSTLLRSVGLNTVLAMAGAPVCAHSLTLTPLQVGASIRINDSLQAGSSRFYAEITRLKQLFEPLNLPLLFLLDELLQGTNSTDRRIGAQGVMHALLARGAIGLISTHDLALTDASEFPDEALHNVHFQDELQGGMLRFDFKLRDGIVTKSNGIELMRAIGLDV